LGGRWSAGLDDLMNDVTRVLYLWLSNDEPTYQDIQYEVESPEDLFSFVELNMRPENDFWAGIGRDLLNLADWTQLYEELKDEGPEDPPGYWGWDEAAMCDRFYPAE